MSELPNKGIRRVAAVRVVASVPSTEQHEVVVEEPLEIRVAGEPLTVTMRTPGDDRQLALGFLFTEGVIARLDDVGSVFHCGRTDDPTYGNALEVTPGPGVSLDVEALSRTRRATVTSSACGVCGRHSIADLVARVPQPAADVRIDSALLEAAPALLSQGQPSFARTGGLHAASAITAHGRIVAQAEDVGRHNAVDKVIGKLLYAGALPRGADDPPCLLVVSGRASFEIVQKAAASGFACVASVSAASSLAIETAEALGVTLASFVRDGRYTLYSHAERVVLPSFR